MKSLKEVTSEFGEAYINAKETEKEKKEAQKAFFTAVNQELAKSLARRTVSYPEKPPKNFTEWVEAYYPGWRYVTRNNDEITIEENPETMAFTYINPDDEIVYARHQVTGAPSLDDEALKKDDPEFWEEVSDYPELFFDLVYGALYGMYVSIMNGQPKDAIERQAKVATQDYLEHRGVQRVIKPIVQLTDEQVDRLQPYMVPGSVSVSLTAPRPAKAEELE